MRSPALKLALFLVLLVSAGAAVFWFLVDDNARGGSTAAPVAASKPAAPATAAELSGLAPVSDEATPGDELADRIAAEEKKVAPVARTWDPETSVWVSGSVAIPGDTPGDEELRVLAFESGPELGARTGDARWTARKPDRATELGRDGLLATAAVDAAGSFKIGLPPDIDEAWLVLQGRYLYCKSSERVKVGAEAPTATFTPVLGAWISGRVSVPRDASEDERELEGVNIELGPDPMQFVGGMGFDEDRAPPGREVEFGDELAFEFGGVWTGFAYMVRSRPKHLAAVKSDKFNPLPGEHVVLSFALTRGGVVAGKVVDEEGRGLAKVELEIERDPLMFGQGGYEVRDGKSADDGAFELTAVATGKAKLKVQHDGFLDAQQEIEVDEGRRLDGLEIRLSRGNRIAGVVLWPDRKPAADLEVDVIFDMSQIAGMGAFNAFQGARGDGKTDADGKFAVTGLGKGPFTVRASARPEGVVAPEDTDEDEDPTLWRARADGVKPGTEDLELVLEAPLEIAGRVIDEHGAPIAIEFQVHARTKVGGMIRGMGSDVRSERFEDAEGRFALTGLRRGEWELWASSPGFGQAKEVALELPVAVDAAPLELVLERVASVSGVVLAPDGGPAAGAKVAIDLDLQDMMRGSGEEGRQETHAADDGSFVLAGVFPGARSIVASAQGAADSEPYSFDCAPAQQVEGVTLQLRVGGRLLGEIFDAKGKPAPGKTILAQMPSRVGHQRFGTSDSQGHFEMEHLPPGSWQVMSMPFGEATGDDAPSGDDGDFARFFSEMKLTMAEMKDGEDTHVLLGAPPKNPVRVHGHVRLDGKGVSGALVSFIADGFKGMDALRFTNTNAEGAYEVNLNEPGSFLVSVQKLDGNPGHQQSVEFHEIVPEAEEHTLDLDVPAGGISGLVRGPDGEPAAGVRISLTTEGAIQNGSLLGGNYAELATGDDGRYELVWLRPATYTVAAGGSMMGGMFGTDEHAHARQLRSGVQVAAGEWERGIDFKLKTPGSLSGIVRDGSGAPVKDAGVFIRDESGRLLERLSMSMTDASGRFTYGNLEEGTYFVTARNVAQATPQPLSARVRSGEETKVELALDTGTILLVSLSDEEGKPIECKISVQDERGHQVNGLITLPELMEAFTKGSFSTTEQRIGPLPAGKYKVIATTSGGASTTKPVVLSGQAERKLNLRLKE